jgi:signal peptidase I
VNVSQSTTAPEPPPAAAAAGRARPRRPWRENLEAFGVAILMAVLLKPMIIEAYQIPTPSMQPTLMGSRAAGVHDRILVDKIRYEIFEPKRWDIVVFRYPIRRNQNYVKRIVGVPGDRLRVSGGNLYQVGADGAIDGIAAKPERVQAGLWKEIYPARRLLEESSEVLGDYFVRRSGQWRQDGDDLVTTPTGGGSGRAQIRFLDRQHEGFSNQIWDGYPIDVARAIREDARRDSPFEGVQDVRVQFVLQPQANVDELDVELQLSPAGHPAHRLVLRAEGGQGRLAILVGDAEVARSDPFDFPMPAAGSTSRLGFAHVDDHLFALRDGAVAAELPEGEHRLTTTLEPSQVALTIGTRSAGELRLSELTVDRDLHYVPTGLEDALHVLVPEGTDRTLANHVIEVPDGHFFMMGDNTLASADSRQWQVITVGATEDGMLVDPRTHPDARVLRGNRRPWPLSKPPDPDENPVIVRGQPLDDIVFTDDNGEVFALRGKLVSEDGQRLRFADPDGDGHQWSPEIENVFFVPREHVLGRPLATFWPWWRVGLIR